MSYFDYQASKDIGDHPFYALLMAAMRRADSSNAAKLRAAFPEEWAELDARYNAPGGFLSRAEAETYGAINPTASRLNEEV